MSKTSGDDVICRRCGLKLTWWYGKSWKHATGGGARSCGKPPQPISRAEYEAEEERFAAEARAVIDGLRQRWRRSGPHAS
jgi:hypothetical protein